MVGEHIEEGHLLLQRGAVGLDSNSNSIGEENFHQKSSSFHSFFSFFSFLFYDTLKVMHGPFRTLFLVVGPKLGLEYHTLIYLACL